MRVKVKACVHCVFQIKYLSSSLAVCLGFMNKLFYMWSIHVVTYMFSLPKECGRKWSRPEFTASLRFG